MHTKARLVTATIAFLWINGASADGSGAGPNSWIGYVFGGNQATGSGSAVAAGTSNVASGQGSLVGAGTANQANGISSLVIGGFDNRATVIDATVVSGAGNRATGARSVVVGGGYNVASGNFSFIGGGGRAGTASTPAGSNIADNIATGDFSTIGGGEGNLAGSLYATVGGGNRNTASTTSATVGGGFQNLASNASTTVSGGSANNASGVFATVGGGFLNTASGEYAAVGGGYVNTASGDYSFAAGRSAVASGHGSFAIADNCCGTLSFPVSVANSFGARYAGGFTFASSVNPTTGLFATGCQLFGGGGSWACSSDRDTKTAVAVIDARSILQNVVDMPVTRWRFQGEAESVRHIGPMAQDFRAAFGLGHDDKSISMLDAQGVALAAIQGMHQLVEEKDARIAALEAKVDAQQKAFAELHRSVEVLLARTSAHPQVAQR